jgi:hypothetical protein
MANVVNIPVPARKADILVIRLTDSKNNIQVNGKSLLKMGDYIYIPAGKSFEILNGRDGKDEFGFFELK